MTGGDGERFTEFMVSRWPGLLRLACGLTADPGLAEEAARAALANAYAAWGQVHRADDPDAQVRRMLVRASTRGAARRRLPGERTEPGTHRPAMPEPARLPGPAGQAGAASPDAAGTSAGDQASPADPSTGFTGPCPDARPSVGDQPLERREPPPPGQPHLPGPAHPPGSQAYPAPQPHHLDPPYSEDQAHPAPQPHHAGQQAHTPDHAHPPDPALSSEQSLTQDQAVPLLAELAKLPPRQRAVLVLRYWQDLPDAHVAAALRCSRAAVRAEASRGLAALRRAGALGIEDG